MTAMKTLAATALAIGLAGLGTPAAADDSQFYGAAAIDVGLPGATPVVSVRNYDHSHRLSALQLAVEGNTIAVTVGGYVDCTGTQFENFAQRFGHYLSGGAFGIGRTSLLTSKALPHSSSIDHTSDMDAHTFQMPVALLANPQIAVDPVAVVMAAADKAPSKLAWLRQDHVLTVKIPLRWEAACAFYSRNKITKQTTRKAAQLSYLTRDVELKINYKGDPQLFEVNAQLSQGGGLPNQVQVGAQPFKVTTMQFQPNMPHHIGTCPAKTTIRVTYMGQGKGEIRIRINEGGKTIHDSPKIAFDSQNGWQHYDFEIATPKALPHELNKTVEHDLRVYLRGKDEKAATWPASYQPMDAAVWKHRCTPQVNPSLGGGGPTVQFKQPAPGPATPVIRRAQ